jgi:glutaryl-CoA dehydrogenase
VGGSGDSSPPRTPGHPHTFDHQTSRYLAYRTGFSARCTERQQLGKPLVSFQIGQDKLVNMLVELCSMQLYRLRLGRLIEEGKLIDTIAALAKMNNTRKGPLGDPRGTRSARWQRDPAGLPRDATRGRHRSHPHYEATETIQTLIVGRDITRVSAFA